MHYLHNKPGQKKAPEGARFRFAIVVVEKSRMIELH